MMAVFDSCDYCTEQSQVLSVQVHVQIHWYHIRLQVLTKSSSTSQVQVLVKFTSTST